MNLAEINFSATLRGWLWTSNLLTENNVVLNTTYTYNVGNLVTNKTTTNSAGTALQTDNYSYLCDGNVFTENDKSYTYDLRNRLSGVAQTDEDNKNYTFNSLGNRLTKTIGSDTINYTYDKNNRILTQSDDLGVTNYSYDDRGNLYLKTVSFVDDSLTSPTAQPMSISDTDSQMLEFDGFNRMSGFETGSTTAEYEYNSDGLRTSKTVNGERTEFVLDGIYVIAEINADGDVTNYIRGLTGIIYREIPDGAKAYYVTNNHGDVTKLVNSSGTVIQTYVYDEYGNVKSSTGTDTNPFRYCGEYFETESGLIYLRARYYDTSIGRFISEDPAMDDLNWYIYSSNNPLNFTDPLGLEKIVVSGGNYGDSHGYKYNFIEPAIKMLKDLVATNDGEPITWAIANNGGWSDEDWANFQTVADDLGVYLVEFSSADNLIYYMNNKHSGAGVRQADPITSLTVFAHGNRDKLMLGYDYEKDQSVLDLSRTDLYSISKYAFKAPVSAFYSCRAAASTYNPNSATGEKTWGNNFATVWHNRFGGTTKAFATKTDYSNIMYPSYHSGLESLLSWSNSFKIENKIESAREETGFSQGGSYSYPTGEMVILR